MKAITLAEASFQATNSVPSGPTNGTAPMELPGPLGVSARLTAKVAPWSVEWATRMPPLVDPPIAASQAT